jgi:hypothetical protein
MDPSPRRLPCAQPTDVSRQDRALNRRLRNTSKASIANVRYENGATERSAVEICHRRREYLGCERIKKHDYYYGNQAAPLDEEEEVRAVLLRPAESQAASK